MAELIGKDALIVGGDEIGLGIAERLKREGARASVTDEAGAAIDADILVVNLLGAPHLAPLEAHTDGAFAAALGRVGEAARTMQRALPSMQRRGGGRIVLVGHRYGETVSEGIGAYNAAAFALVGLIRTAAVEWGKHGVSTNLLIPFADTAELRAAREKRPKIIDLMLSQTPLKRAGDVVSDIGGAVVFLVSEDAAFVNGQIIYADGGQHIAGPVLNPIKYANP